MSGPKRNDGGPAFPQALSIEQEFLGSDGMALRDYFAAKAMHAELVSSGSFKGPAEALSKAAADHQQSISERIAWLSYQLADAMLAERAK